VNPDSKLRAKSRLTTYSTLATDPSTAWNAMAANHCERVQPSDVGPTAELGRGTGEGVHLSNFASRLFVRANGSVTTVPV